MKKKNNDRKKIVTIYVCLMMIATSFSGILLFTDTVKSEEASGDSSSMGELTGVDPATGSFYELFPLLSISGRGVDVNVNLRYDSRIWLADPDGANQEIGSEMIGVPDPLIYNGDKSWLGDYSCVGLGFDLSMGRLLGHRIKYQLDNDYYWYRFAFEDPYGGSTLFVSDNPEYYLGGSNIHGFGYDTRFIALDGSGAVLLVDWEEEQSEYYPTNFTVVIPDGIRYCFSSYEALLDIESGGFGPTTRDIGGGSGSDSNLHTIHFDKIGTDAGLVEEYYYEKWRSEAGNTHLPSYAEIRREYLSRHGGGWYYPPITPGYSSASWACHAIEDNNGNRILIDYYDHPGCDNPNRVLALPETITDTYGRVIHFGAENVTEMIDGSGSYPKARLTNISTNISTTGEPYMVHFNYKENDAPYIVIDDDGGPFREGDGGAGEPYRMVTTQKGESDAARTRVILDSITIDPPGDVIDQTTNFDYNEFYELDSITFPLGGKKVLDYTMSRIAPCIEKDDESWGVVGRQWIRVVDQVRIDNNLGYYASTEYRYLVYPNIDEENPLEYEPLNTSFWKVVEFPFAENVRVEYEYHSLPPSNLYLESGSIYRLNLAGLLKEKRIFEVGSGVLKGKNQIFYAMASEDYNHFSDDSEFYYGNLYSFIYPMGHTNWQEGQSSVVVKGVDGVREQYYPNELFGFCEYWQIQSDEFQDAWQNGDSYPCPGFSLTIVNPQNTKVQNITAIIDDPNYRTRGLWHLVSEIEEGEASESFDGYISIGVFDYISHSVPFEYEVMRTTEMEYDNEDSIGSLLPIPPGVEGSYEDPGTICRGLVTKQSVVETGEHSEMEYYYNGLLHKTHSHVGEDFGSTVTFEYGGYHCWDMLSKETVTDPYSGTLTTKIEWNPLGQITHVEDVDNGFVEEFTYDGVGRQLTHDIQILRHPPHFETISSVTYQDNPNVDGGIYVETTAIAGPDLEDKTITRTYYDELMRAVETVERSGNEDNWMTSTIVVYNDAGQIEQSYLPVPYDDGISRPYPGRCTTYEYDVFGRVNKSTDVLGREATTTVFYGEENIDEDLWNRGARTKAVVSGSWGAERIEFMDACGLVLQSSVKISDNNYANTTFYYDAGGRLWKQESPEGLPTYYFYDDVGRLVATDDPDVTNTFSISRGTNFTYPKQEHGDTVYVDSFTEDLSLAGQPVRVRTSRGFFHFAYDSLGRLIWKGHSDTRDGEQKTLEEHSYDPDESLTPENAHGRLAKSTYYDQQDTALSYSVTFGYDEIGHVAAQNFKLGDRLNPVIDKTVCFEYDWLGRSTKTIYPDGTDVDYEYIGSRLDYIKLNGNVLADAKYDKFRRLSELNIGSHVSTRFTYNDLSDRLDIFSVVKKQVRYIDSAGMEEAHAFFEDDKNSYGQPKGVIHSGVGIIPKEVVPRTDPISEVLLFEKYEYDPDSGELCVVRDATGSLKRSYSYDLLGRLTSAQLFDLNYVEADESFVYSPGDNVLVDYGLNKDSVRTSKIITYDSSELDHHTYNYDAGTHRLSDVICDGVPIFEQEFDDSGSVIDYNGDDIERDCLGQIKEYDASGQIETYGYMAAGVRVRRTTSDGTTFSLCLGNDVIAEYSEDGSLIRNHYYGFDNRLATKQNNGDIDYLISDTHGDLRFIIDDKNTVRWQGEYTPFGQCIEIINDMHQEPGQVGFDGYIKESSGLTYAFARNYDERRGVYLSMDPLNSGDNPYSYCSGAPVRCRDPTGLCGGPLTWKQWRERIIRSSDRIMNHMGEGGYSGFWIYGPTSTWLYSEETGWVLKECIENFYIRNGYGRLHYNSQDKVYRVRPKWSIMVQKCFARGLTGMMLQKALTRDPYNGGPELAMGLTDMNLGPPPTGTGRYKNLNDPNAHWIIKVSMGLLGAAAGFSIGYFAVTAFAASSIIIPGTYWNSLYGSVALRSRFFNFCIRIDGPHASGPHMFWHIQIGEAAYRGKTWLTVPLPYPFNVFWKLK